MSHDGAAVADGPAAAVRFGWGRHGLLDVGVGARTVVIVDVLSFSTTVSVATSRGAEVWPIAWDDADAADVAQRYGAHLARRRREVDEDHPFSLSPASVVSIDAGTRLVLPSPNGARLCDAARQMEAIVLAGCLRNRTAVAARAAQIGSPVAVVAAGERWPDGSLRPAFEDLVGAGAVIDRLVGAHGLTPSVDAQAAAAAFRAADPVRDFAACASGRELAQAGYADDVRLAAQVDTTPAASEVADDGWVRGTAPADADARAGGGRDC